MQHSPDPVPRLQRQLDVGRFRVDDVWYPPGYRQPRHAHPHHGISLVLAGHLREGVGRVEEDARQFSLVIKPARVIHTDEVGPDGARLLQIAVRDDLAWQQLPRGRWRWLHTGAGVRRMFTLLGALSNAAERLEDGILELLAELGEPDRRAQGAAPPWLCAAREILDDLPGETPTVSHLAQAVGVHPVSLTRAFRRCYGVTVSAYRRHVRLRQAAGIIDRDRDFSFVAQEAGYADHAHLCRDMRRLTGLSPSELRRIMRTV